MGKDVIIACDFKNKEEFLKFIEKFEGLNPFLKIGMEIFYKEGPELVRELKAKGCKIFLDLKLHDIPNTVEKAMRNISELGVEITNCHAAGGIEMMKAARRGLDATEKGKTTELIAVTQLTSISQEALEKELLIEKPLPEVVKTYALNAKEAGLQGVDAVCKESGKVGIISIGWDPGLFSLNRMLGQAILPCGNDYTFWGKGVSQGHSDAIRRIAGVKDARQYTIPVEEALTSVRNGENPELTTRQKHTRECFVVAEDGADLKAIEEQIVTMPNYFADYDTTVHFISEEELMRDHKGIPHGGMVFRTGTTGFNNENKHVVEFKLTLDSNPEFTSSVLVAYARAAYRLAKEGNCGCKTIFDIAPAYIHPASPEELRKNLL